MVSWETKTNNNLKTGIMMKIKKLIYVLVGTLVVASSCSDTELGNGKEGTGTEPASQMSALSKFHSTR